jgi:hypothetical protein
LQCGVCISRLLLAPWSPSSRSSMAVSAADQGLCCLLGCCAEQQPTTLLPTVPWLPMGQLQHTMSYAWQTQ